jgi:type II secretory pathway pseudopilin PulG
MRKKMKSHKAMTLYEMIISLAIFAVMCLILVTVGMHIDRVSRATTDLKKKVASEAPYAANKLTKDNTGADLFDPAKDVKDLEIEISIDGGALKTYYVPGVTAAKSDHASIKMDAKKYNTERAYTGNDPISAADAAAAVNGQLNLEFIQIVTSAASSSSTTTTTTT